MNQQNAKAFDRFAQVVPLADQQRLLLARYIDLVEEWNVRNNLVSANDLFRIAERHLPDSWNFCQQQTMPNNARVLDLGSGAGFPGVVGAVLRSDVTFMLLDSRRMRALFLKQAVTELRLTNAQVLCQRAESMAATHAGCFDVVTARAVAGLEELWGWAHPLLKPTGQLVTQKGREEVLSLPAQLSVTKTPMIHTVSDSVLVIVKGERSE